MDVALGVRRRLVTTLMLPALVGLVCLSPRVQAAFAEESPAIYADALDDPTRSTDKIVIWHIPHPDDETIGMAGGILAAAKEGARNIVVFYTEGEASDVRLVLNGLVYCTWHGRFHRPHAEGYEPLDKAAFARARMLETTMALRALGVEQADIISIGLPDGGVTVADAFDVMQTLDLKFPGAAHRTTALRDGHADHRILARALNTLLQQKRLLGEELDVQFHSVYAYRLSEKRRATALPAVPVADLERKRHALDEFALWAPETGRFAIGMHSVPGLIAHAATDPFEYVEGPPKTFGARHLRSSNIAVNVFSTEASLQLRLVPALFVRVGLLYSGTPTPPTLFYEAPTFINAAKWRFGIAPTSGNDPRIGVELAGLRILNHLLIEYRPMIRPAGKHGSILLGVTFEL